MTLSPLPPIADEASARLHLAALYRLIDRHFPSTDGIYNHITLRLPERPEAMLIKRAIARGAIVVAAMGNDFTKGNPTSYPAAIDGVIAVGATDESDRRASFSQTGPHIHLMAPGVNVLSTVPTYPSSLASTTSYEAWPGTSMATPFVTATVALMLAKRPKATVTDIRNALRKGADPIPGQQGFDHEHGHGRLNVRKSLAAV